MITLQSAVDLIVNRIVNPDKATHQDYERVVKHATLYEQLITGEYQDDIVKRFFSKQDENELQKIINITQPITSSVCNNLIVAFKKVLRTNPTINKIDFQKFTDEKLNDVKKAVANYYAESSVDTFIKDRFHDLSFIDPNAFIVTEFKPFDHLKEKAKPYPFEVDSKSAINYAKINGVLQFLLVENRHSYLNEKQEPITGKKWYLYLTDHTIVVTQTDKSKLIGGAKYGNTEATIMSGDVKIETRGIDDKFNATTETLPILITNGDYSFTVEYFTHKCGRVPAYQIGYVPDKKTKGRTYVNPFHYGAMPYLMKTIKSVCELDLTTYSHTFPQKIMYQEGCSFDANGICGTSGERIDQCQRCGKKGYLEHTSAKDVMRFKLPRNPEDMIDLDKLIKYVYPPIDGIKFQDEYINSLTTKCYRAVFNADVFSKDEIQATATGKNIDLQNVYDTLYDYAGKIADYRIKTVTLIGILLDYNDIIVDYKFPKDFKLKSVTDLLADLKTAMDSGAAMFVKSEISRDIANQFYMDKPLEMLKYEVMQKLQPFVGKTTSEISLILNSEFAQRIDKVVYNYFIEIMEELEEESLMADKPFVELLNGNDVALKLFQANKSKWFYDYPFALQKALLYAKGNVKLAAIDNETPKAVNYGTGVNGGGV